MDLNGPIWYLLQSRHGLERSQEIYIFNHISNENIAFIEGSEDEGT